MYIYTHTIYVQGHEKYNEPWYTHVIQKQLTRKEQLTRTTANLHGKG